MRRFPRLIEGILITAGALTGTVFFTWPLAGQLNTHLVELGDSRLNAYIQSWVTHALMTSPLHLFDANMYYPARNVLSGSENMIGNQLLFAPVYLVSGNPILATNVVILASFFLSALTMYLLVRLISGQPAAAAVAGAVYAFALPRVAQINHMQLLSTQWIPLAVLFLYLFVLEKQARFLVAFSAFLLLQILCSLYAGYLAIVVVTCFFTALAFTRHELLTKPVLGGLMAAIASIGIVIVPIGLHYQRWEKRALLTPPFLKGWTLAGSADPRASYLDVADFPHHVYHHLLAGYTSVELGGEKQLFMGFVPMLLALVALFSISWYRRNRMDSGEVPGISAKLNSLRFPLFLGSMLTTIGGYVLSLGPYLRIHDRTSGVVLPYLILQKVVPGMGSFRVPARFGFAVLFGLAILAGFGFLRLTESNFAQRRASVRVLLIVGVLLSMSLEFKVTPLELAAAMGPEEVAPEYQWLKLQPRGSVTLELPINGSQDLPDPYEEAGYVYASIYHWQPIMNGYTGNPPRSFTSVVQLARKMPDPAACEALARLGLRYVVIHPDRMSAAESSRWRNPSARLHEAARFNDGAVIYEPSHQAFTE